MPNIILKCVKCGKYTLKHKCNCDGEVFDPRPAKFSVEDKYGHYRRLAKKIK